MKPSAPYRRRCSACGASALQVASRCPGCGEAMQTRDARGERLVLWGCHGCHTLNEPDHTTCPHCAAPRPRGVPARRAAGLALAVAAVATIIVVGSSRTPTPAAPLAAAPTSPVESAPTATVTPVVAVTDPVERIPVSPPPPPPIPATLADREVRRPAALDDPRLPIVEVVSVTWVNVRTAPTPNAEIVGVIKPQTSALRLGERAGWVQLRTDTLEGWVYAQGLTER